MALSRSRISWIIGTYVFPCMTNSSGSVGLTQRWSELPPRFAVFDFILNLSCREGWLMRRHGGSRSAFVR